MKVIHVARKPIEGTIARTAIKYDVGGLHIDECRIKMQGGDKVIAGLADPANRQGAVGVGLGFTKTTKDKFQAAQLASVEKTNAMGRWPANLILSHLPGCCLTGTREVKCNNAVFKNTPEGELNCGMVGPVMKRLPHGEYGHGGADHKETIEVWECAPGCPVAGMDHQSGVSVSRGGGYNWDSSGNDNPTKVTKNIKSGQHFSDQGGAARYFKQIQGVE